MERNSSSMRKTRIKSITPFLTCLGFHDIIMCCKQFFYLTSDLFSLFMKAAHSLSFTIALISNTYPVCGWNNENYLRNFSSYPSYHFSFSLKMQYHTLCFECIHIFYKISSRITCKIVKDQVNKYTDIAPLILESLLPFD